MLITPAPILGADGIGPARSIIRLALDGLPQMLDHEEQLFCFRFRKSKSGTTCRELTSKRYTVMTVLGLLQAEAAGYPIQMHKAPIVDRVLSDLSWVQGAGDIGLLLWLCSTADPDRLPALFRSVEGPSILQRCRDVRKRRTMELAWLLTGVSLSVEAGFQTQETVALARSAYRLLCSNQGTTGLFGHEYAGSSILARFRAHIGSFADQAYPIFALVKYSAALDVREPLDHALRCAEAICCRQGALGQWWWHYDRSSGKVVGRYPVYSVHQDGMAPMALYALQDATGQNFEEPIHKGLAWIPGKNELCTDLRDESSKVIWRNLRVPNYLKYFEEISSAALPDHRCASEHHLRFTFECRPYELGWALYALAERVPSRDDAPHLKHSMSHTH